MRSSLNNPFVPGSDTVPAVWAGRAKEVADFHTEVRPRRLAGAYERGRVFIGEPGIGKSALAAKICGESRDRGDLVLPSLRVPKGGDPIALLAGVVADAIGTHSLGERVGGLAAGLLDRITAIRAGVTVTLSGAPAGLPHRELTTALSTLARIAMDDDRLLVVHIDEVQNITSGEAMSQLLVALGDVLAETTPHRDAAGNAHDRHLPVAVIMTGLWSFVDDATRAAGATFARRFKPFHLGPVEDADIRTALAPFTSDGWPVLGEEGPGVVTVTADALQVLVESVLGDPFLLQLVGKAAWNAGTSPVIDRDDVRAGVAEVATEMRHHGERALERLPRTERELLEALVRLAPSERTLTNAGRELGKSSEQLGSASKRLELRSIIQRGRPITITSRTTEALLRSDWPE